MSPSFTQMSDQASVQQAAPQQHMDARSPMINAPARYEVASQVQCCCGCMPSIVPTGSIGVVQDMGKFVGIQEPGCATFCPGIREITTVSLAVQQLMCSSDCKTKDNVTVTVCTAVQYRIMKSHVKTAVFEVVDPTAQMRAFVDNVLRSFVPSLDLDHAYEAKDEMTRCIQQSVSDSMGAYGYQILNVLITDLRPEASILRAMNDINASRRHREAAIEKGEAEKILVIKNSEADAEAMHLAGVGMAQMRKAVADGFKESMVAMEKAGISASEASQLMITTQYLDMLKDFSNEKSSIMIPHGPGAVADISRQITESLKPTEASSSSSVKKLISKR